MENESVIKALGYKLFKVLYCDWSSLGVKLELDLLAVFHFNNYHFYRLENELPEGFTVFNVEPDSLNARRKLRTTNMVEFQNKELKKRTRCIRVFPNKESLLRIATALLLELDEKWLANGKVYLKG